MNTAGAILINTSSSHLIDDCALKQAIIEGTVAGCALDGVESPHWIEAWVYTNSHPTHPDILVSLLLLDTFPFYS